MKEIERVPVQITKETHARLKAIADREGIFIWKLVETILSEQVDKYDHKRVVPSETSEA